MSSTSTHDDPLEPSLPQKRAAPKVSLLLHRSAQLLKNTETASKPATSTVSQSRTRGGREVDDDNGEDDDDDGAHVVPQHPELTCQTAVDEPADTSNPNPTSARPTVPVGKSNGPSSKGVEGSGEPTPSPPDEAIRPLPLSTPLEGEKSDEAERSSGHTHKATMHDNNHPPLHPNHPKPPPPRHHKQPYDDATTKSIEPVARMCTDTQHDPGGETKAPPSVWLEGESRVELSRHVEPTDVKMNDVDVEGHRDTQKEPRDSVGTTDGDERHPSMPIEPPDKVGAAKWLSAKLRVRSTVKCARESSRKVEGKRRSQSEGRTAIEMAE
ncbi:hypothetical protein PAXINDRAFT_12084 [Paxillus involutus ATCC 200175]|uniref:Uncharacterized protein n=1 Tax=Paxillus involutus ATCC 200175 TaxID=664439 RepID=A0A0C9TY34_PAXIN|nr:hypothetical protein PAXINDRAFT_12084 [Paxillus involutus ATCC 200175]